MRRAETSKLLVRSRRAEPLAEPFENGTNCLVVQTAWTNCPKHSARRTYIFCAWTTRTCPCYVCSPREDGVREHISYLPSRMISSSIPFYPKSEYPPWHLRLDFLRRPASTPSNPLRDSAFPVRLAAWCWAFSEATAGDRVFRFTAEKGTPPDHLRKTTLRANPAHPQLPRLGPLARAFRFVLHSKRFAAKAKTGEPLMKSFASRGSTHLSRAGTVVSRWSPRSAAQGDSSPATRAAASIRTKPSSQ